MKKKNVLIIVISIMIIVTIGITNNGMAQGSSEQKTEQQPRVTMMLFETDLREALNEISLQTGISIIPDQTVSGVVTADLQNVPLEEALRKILIGGGYTFRKIDDFYLVGLPNPKSNTFGALSELEVIELNHITAREVLNLLPSFLKPYVNGTTNSDLLTINAPSRELKRIKGFINKLDKPHKQIKIKAVVTEVDSTVAKEIGNSSLSYEEEPTGDNTRSLEYSLEDNLLTLSYDQLLTKLKVLEKNQKAKVEANPQVLVADGETAKLFIGEQQTLIITPDKNDDYSSRVEEIEVGVELGVRANIVGEDEVRLEINPKISHFVDSARPDLVIKKNSVSTTLRLKSGQTTALAGMTIDDNSTYNKKVPILGDIPLVRWLFSNSKKQKSDKELLIFVTPVIQ